MVLSALTVCSVLSQGSVETPHCDGFKDGFCQITHGILMSGFIASPHAESRQEEAETTFLDS